MAEGMDDDEVKYLSTHSSVNGFGGEDLCERAVICRRNGYENMSEPLNKFNERFIKKMVEKESNESKDKIIGDYELESIVQSIMDLKGDNSADNSTSGHESDDDDIEELLDESEVSVKWIPNVLMKPKEEEFVGSGYSSRLYLNLILNQIK